MNQSDAAANPVLPIFVEGADIPMLRRLSSAHYDMECKKAGREAGIINQLKPNAFNLLQNAQIQTLWKCCEIGSFLDGEERLRCVAFIARCKGSLAS